MTDPVYSSALSALERVVEPVRDFARQAASGGVVLLACALLALAAINSPLAHAYQSVWHEQLAVAVAGFGVSKSLHFWINDGLMSVFFFVVGLEIKREMLVGDLHRAAGHVAADGRSRRHDVAGCAVPILQCRRPRASGWGIPMATDIAFALGVLALFGPRVPGSLKVFLTALAIFDDIGAVLVIAFFYTGSLTVVALAAGGALLGLTVLANWLGVRSMLVYTILGIALWVAMLNSGFHATVAGILLALVIPARARIDAPRFVTRGQSLIEEFRRVSRSSLDALGNNDQQRVLLALEDECERAGTPLQRLEHLLHPWVAFLVLPLFALANAGVAVGGMTLETLTNPVTLGVFAGLVAGKPLGIVVCVWLAVRLRLADLPPYVEWPQIVAVGCLSGIGFTMALFIGGLAFDADDALEAAKIGILAGSIVAGIIGAVVLHLTFPRVTRSHSSE